MASESVNREPHVDNGRAEFANPLTGEIIDNDAIEIGVLYEKARTSIVESVRYQIECGQRLIEKKKSMLHGSWLPWLRDNEPTLGFSSRQTAGRLMKLATSANGALAHHLDAPQAALISRKTWGHDQADSQLVQQSLSNEHYTPSEYLQAARDVLGDFDLDPASCEEANEVVQAARFFTADDDGLKRDWNGRVWLNPPYGNLVGPFITKLVGEIVGGRVSAAVALVNAHCTDTSWFQPLWDGWLCFTDHRINFYGDDTRSGSTHGSVFVYFGDNHELFAARFAEFGAVVRRVMA